MYMPIAWRAKRSADAATGTDSTTSPWRGTVPDASLTPVSDRRVVEVLHAQLAPEAQLEAVAFQRLDADHLDRHRVAARQGGTRRENRQHGRDCEDAAAGEHSQFRGTCGSVSTTV